MDNIVYASVRQVSATRYSITLTKKRPHEEALEVGMMQADLYLSGLVDAAAAPYLEGARKALAGVMQGRVQN